MKNYYEVLGLEPGATAIEIKKAYFSMVRKYPPDRFQEEFMKIREAYEVLSNEKTKKQYDSLLELSPETREKLDFARNNMQEGDFEAAIKNLEQILRVQPETLIVKALLGEAYLNNGNSGKAIKIFEELADAEPRNASFVGHLANAYLARGWHKRAINVFKKAVELDEDNLYLWIGYSQALIASKEFNEARSITEKAIEKVKENKAENTALYMQLIMLDLMQHRLEEMNTHIDQLIALSSEAEDIRGNVGWTLAQLAKAMMQSEMLTEAAKLISKVAQLLPEDENILKLKDEIENFEKLEKIFQDLELDDDIDDEIVSLIALEIFPEDNLNLDVMQRKAFIFLHEMMVLEDIHRFKSVLKKLKRKYPELYEVKKEFFDSALDPVKYKKLLNTYRNKRNFTQEVIEELMNRARMEDYFYDDEDYEDDDYYYDDFEIQQPFVREEPKVGRNDPCPCGSGKKYKKCCGKGL